MSRLQAIRLRRRDRCPCATDCQRHRCGSTRSHRLRHAVHRAAAVGEIHRGLAEAVCALPATDEVLRGAAPLIKKTPKHINRPPARPNASHAKCSRAVAPNALMHPRSHQTIEPRALIDFVKVWKQLILVQHTFPVARLDGRAIQLFSVPSIKSLAGIKSFKPCWY